MATGHLLILPGASFLLSFFARAVGLKKGIDVAGHLLISALEQPADRASSAVERGAGGSGAAQRGEGGGGREILSPRFSV